MKNFWDVNESRMLKTKWGANIDESISEAIKVATEQNKDIYFPFHDKIYKISSFGNIYIFILE